MSLSVNVKNYQRIPQCSVNRWDTGGMFVLASSDQREVTPKYTTLLHFAQALHVMLISVITKKLNKAT